MSYHTPKEQQSMPDLIGRILGHYRIVDKIGAGGMGEVYRARDERLDRDVAVKVLPEKVAADPDRLNRFEREAKALAALNHPNIAMVFGLEMGRSGADSDADSGAAQGFLVMELLEGESLRELMSKAGITTGKAAEYARAIADGLAAAHEKGIVHRDLKPENVFLTKDGRIKILDFGLAKLRMPEEDLTTETPTQTMDTAPGGLMGTIPYMAPEQVQGKTADHRSDIFALGVVLYEMLCGKRPFGGSTSVETAAAILKEDPEPISTTAAGVPPALATVVAKCLEKRPEDRFSSAHDLSLTLGALDAAAPAPPVVEISVITKRWPHVLAIAIAAVIALLVILPPEALFERGSVQPGDEPIPRIVVLPFENLGSPDDAFFAEGMTEEITARLAAVEGIQVISRTSARQYAKTAKSIPEIGEELGVGFVLEGTIRWARSDGGSRIRITPQLIRVADDSHLWVETYDRVLDDVFEIQSEIAQVVTSELGITLGGGEKGPHGAKPTDNLEAYQAYLRGRYWESRPHFTYENWERSMEAFARAVELDPDFALAHAELARGHALVRYFRHDLTPDRLEAAAESAQKALDLAPGDPRVHLDLGYYRLWAYRDVDGAVAEFQTAAEGLAGSAEIFNALKNVYIIQGQWEMALDSLQRGIELSPRDADLISGSAWVLIMLRRYPEALAASDQAISLAPDAFWPYFYKILNYWCWHGDASETRPVLEALRSTAGGWERWTWYWQEMYEGRYHEALLWLESATEEWIKIKMNARPNVMMAAFAYERLGDTGAAAAAYEQARRVLEAEVEKTPEDPRIRSSLGIVYAAQGRRDDAVREGELACELLPRSEDGFYYLPYVIDLAHIYTILGDNEAAFEQLEHLLANPSYTSAPYLRMDPKWDPLRDDPRFEALLERFAIH
jgi:serine/threonine protein kinase/tetratricopeptide (TPR) repeat protein